MGCKFFCDFMFEHALRDLGVTSSNFTWYRGGLSQRLDRAIYNLEWTMFALDCSVRNLDRLKYD